MSEKGKALMPAPETSTVTDGDGDGNGNGNAASWQVSRDPRGVRLAISVERDGDHDALPDRPAPERLARALDEPAKGAR